MRQPVTVSTKSGALLWFWQRVSAVILFIMLLFHFISYHFMAQGAYQWHRVVVKMQSPWFNLLQFLFLLSALYHGLNGVWMISEDYLHSGKCRMLVLSGLVVLGISLLFIGTLTLFKIAALDLNSTLPKGCK